MVAKKALATHRTQTPKCSLETAWDSMMGSVAYIGPSYDILMELFCGTFGLHFVCSSEDPITVPAWDALHLVSCLSEAASVTAQELAHAINTITATCERCA